MSSPATGDEAPHRQLLGDGMAKERLDGAVLERHLATGAFPPLRVPLRFARLPPPGIVSCSTAAKKSAA